MNKPPINPKMFFIFFVAIFFIIGFAAGGFILGSKEKLSKDKPCPTVARICNDGQVAKLGKDCAQICPEDSRSLTPTISDETLN